MSIHYSMICRYPTNFMQLYEALSHYTIVQTLCERVSNSSSGPRYTVKPMHAMPNRKKSTLNVLPTQGKAHLVSLSWSRSAWRSHLGCLPGSVGRGRNSHCFTLPLLRLGSHCSRERGLLRGDDYHPYSGLYQCIVR